MVGTPQGPNPDPLLTFILCPLSLSSAKDRPLSSAKCPLLFQQERAPPSTRSFSQSPTSDLAPDVSAKDPPALCLSAAAGSRQARVASALRSCCKPRTPIAAGSLDLESLTFPLLRLSSMHFHAPLAATHSIVPFLIFFLSSFLYFFFPTRYAQHGGMERMIQTRREFHNCAAASNASDAMTFHHFIRSS